MTSDEEVKKYINESFIKQTLNLIYKNLENLFDLFVKILVKYESQILKPMGENIKDRITNAGLIQQILNYLEQLASNNMAILNIIVEFFGKTFDFETNHICSDIQINSKHEIKFAFIDKYHQDQINKAANNFINNRKCKCYFLTLLLRNWNEQLDTNFDKTQTQEKEYKIDKVLVTFVKSYKFKILYAFSYFSQIDTILKNKSEHIRSLSVQIMTIENIAEKLVSEERLIYNFYEKIIQITEKFKKEVDDEDEYEENLTALFNIYYEFYLQTYYLCKPKPAKILAKNFYILKVMIDIVAMIQNSNKLKIASSFQKEGYNEQFMYIEFYLLQMFSLLISNTDYSDFYLTQELVFYIIDKIIFEDHKIKLAEDEFSFHIPLNRAFGILLNRICFDYYENKNLDFNETLRQLIFSYYNSLGIDEQEFKKEYSEMDIEIRNERSSLIFNYESNIINKDNPSFIESDSNQYQFSCKLNSKNANQNFIHKNESKFISEGNSNNNMKFENKNIKVFQISENIKRKKYSNKMNFDEVLKMILKPTLKFISFLHSIAIDKWVFYGENMTFYYNLYNIFEIFSLSDYGIIKMISWLDMEGRVFNMEYFLKETNYNNIYTEEFVKDTFIIENISNIEFITNKIYDLKKVNSKNFNFLLKNFEFFLKLFIPESFNNAFVRLFTFSLSKFNDNKLNDYVFEKFVIGEKHNLIKLLKINLIHIIFSKENSIYFSEIFKNLPFYLKKIFSENEHIDKFLNEIADCYQAKNKPNIYKLKHAYFNSMDLFSYLDFQTRTTAEKHFLEFAKDKFSIINSPDGNLFEFMKAFEIEFFNKFFCRNSTSNENTDIKLNFEFIFNYLSILIKNYEKLDLNDSFIFNFMKFFSLFLNFYKRKFGLQLNNNNIHNPDLDENKIGQKNVNYFKGKILNKEFLSSLQENSNTKKTFSYACKYLLTQIKELFPEIKEREEKFEENITQTTNFISTKNFTDKGKKQQELMKLKFQQKSQQAIKNFDSNFNTTFKTNENLDVIQNSNLSSKNQLLNDYNLNLNEEANYFENKNKKEYKSNNMEINFNNNINKNLDYNSVKSSNDKTDLGKQIDYSNFQENKNISINIKEVKKEEFHEIHCIVCKNQISKSDIFTNPYGKIGILNPSSFILNSKLQTIKSEFEKVIFKNKFTEFHSNSIMNNLKSNIMSNNVNINNTNQNQNNNNNLINSYLSHINNTNNIYTSTFSTFNNNIDNNDFDISKKDSQMMFSQITNQTFVMNPDENLLLKKLMLNFKKNSKVLKKSIRFTTCNHYIHVSCYTKSMHSYINLEAKRLWFSCPLCQTISNCIFPEMEVNLKYNNPQSQELEDINEGITFVEIFKFLNDKKEKEIDIDYLNNHLTIQDVFGKVSIPKNFIFACEDLIEKIISFSHNKFIIKDFNISKNNINGKEKCVNNSISYTNCSKNSNLNTTKANSTQSNPNQNEILNQNYNLVDDNSHVNLTMNIYANQIRYYETLKNFFINSLSLLDILREDGEMSNILYIIRIFILSLRILIKSGSLEFGIFLNRFWNTFYFFKTNIQMSENLTAFIDNDIVSNNFFELLMLVIAFSNSSEFAYFKLLFKHYIPMILLQFLVREFYKNFNFKTSNQNFEKYFNVDELLFIINSPQHSKEIKEHCNFYLRKLTILSKIHQEDYKGIFIKKFENVEEEFAYYANELGFEENFELQDLLRDGNQYYPFFWKRYYNSMEFIIEMIKNYHKYKLIKLSENPEAEDGNLIHYY